MGYFNPLFAFCLMHHDKLIDGENEFGPAAYGNKVDAFLWSDIDVPILAYAIPAKIDDPVVRKIYLERTNQKCGKYNLYVYGGGK